MTSFDNLVEIKIKIITIVCFISLTFALFVAKNAPATQYEASIYSSTPIFLWFFLIISIITGITIIIHQLYSRMHKKNDLWVVGIILIFLSYATILSLYIIRGYYVWNASGDIATHIGWINKIIIDDHIPNDLFYPLTHIYFAEISQILSTDLMVLVQLIPLFFGLSYILFMYLFAKSILSDKGQIILATVASSTFIHGWYLTTTPNHLSNLYFPFLLFVLIKTFITRKMAWKILLLIMVFSYPPFHPVPTLALIIFLVTLWLPQKIFNLTNKELKSYVNVLVSFNFTLLTILFVWGISWISSFGVWQSTVRNVHRLMNEGGPSHVSELANQVTYAQGYGYNVYEQVLKVMGGSLVYIILALICLPIIWKEMNSNKKFSNIFLLYGPLSVLGIFTLVLFILNIGFGPLRMVIYIDILTTIFVGFILYEIINKSRNLNRKYISIFACGFVIIFLVGVSLSGMMKLYPSPYILKTNYQTTQTEIEGMDWLFNNRNLDIDISGISIAPRRFADLLLTHEETIAQNVPYYLTTEQISPNHFGYDNNTFLSNSYENDIYLALTERDKMIYVDVYPDMAEFRWFVTDFEKLEYDSSVDKLYSNAGFDLWYVND